MMDDCHTKINWIRSPETAGTRKVTQWSPWKQWAGEKDLKFIRIPFIDISKNTPFTYIFYRRKSRALSNLLPLVFWIIYFGAKSFSMKKELGQECPNTWYLADIDNYDTRKSQITLSGRFVNYTIAHHCCDFPHQHQTWTNGEWERKRAEQPSSSKPARKSPSWRIGKESGISKHCQGHNGPESWVRLFIKFSKT